MSLIRMALIVSRKELSNLIWSNSISSSSPTISTLMPLSNAPESAIESISSWDTSSSLLLLNELPSPAPRSLSTLTTVPSGLTLIALIFTCPSSTALEVCTAPVTASSSTWVSVFVPRIDIAELAEKISKTEASDSFCRTSVYMLPFSSQIMVRLSAAFPSAVIPTRVAPSRNRNLSSSSRIRADPPSGVSITSPLSSAMSAAAGRVSPARSTMHAPVNSITRISRVSPSAAPCAYAPKPAGSRHRQSRIAVSILVSLRIGLSSCQTVVQVRSAAGYARSIQSCLLK